MPSGGERDYQMNAPTRILHVAQNKGVLPIAQPCIWENPTLQIPSSHFILIQPLVYLNSNLSISIGSVFQA